MSKPTFNPGDEIFYVNGRVTRGIVKRGLMFGGIEVITANGEEVFSDLFAMNKQQAYDECVELAEYFERKANELFLELEQVAI